MRIHVDGRVREERHHGPEQDAHPERETGPQVLAPRPHAPHLLPDDRLGEQAETDEEDPRGEAPVDHLSVRLHLSSPGLRSAASPRRARTRRLRRRRATAARTTTTTLPRRADAAA